MKNLPIYCIIVIGNPLTYLGHNLVWDRVRLLKQYDSLTFDYNASGIRTRKGTTTYELDGTTILSETGSGYTLRYYYDGAELVGFNFNNQDYFYEKNLQGDITGIYNTSGTLVGSYSYDAWGKCRVNFDSTGAAFVNPFRYRGYYYDRETGLYYLNSRYYDPNTGRFINADVFVSTGQGINGTNMFAYCLSNPVNRVDPFGLFFEELWEAFVNTLQQSKGYFAAAAGVSQADTFVPGPADAVSLGLMLGGVLVCAGIATYTTMTAPAPAISIPKAKDTAEEKVTDITISEQIPQKQTIIYRHGGINPGNLTPKKKDMYSGLSFSTVPKFGSAVTTIELLNATGVVYAVQDSDTHVSVRPVGATMEDWINAGSSSIWTKAVKSVVIKWYGGH